MREDFDQRAHNILVAQRRLRAELGGDSAEDENLRLRKAFEAELVAYQEPPSGAQDAHAAYWDGYLHGRERLLARLKAAMEGEA